MEETSKETGQRPTVSMPSLDSSDYFPGDENPESGFVVDNSFVSTDTTANITPESSVIDTVTPLCSTDSILDTSSTTATFTSNDGSLIEAVTTETFVDNPSNVSLIQNTTDTLTDSLDESQNEEDPSIAIDQFIKKIADEQLSSKRIEGRKEEEAQEQESEDLTETKQSTENEFIEVSAKPDEPMEVDDAHTEPDKKIKKIGDEQIQMESIEEIQKEIDKIPPKKYLESESNGQKDSESNENLDEILGDDDTKPNVVILKNALEKQDKSPTIEDSGEVARDSSLIEKAQEEIKKLDILVCGECHYSFNFIKEFTEHKDGQCSKSPALQGVCDAEGKPQVWGFMLWKVKQTKDLTEDIPSAWSLYQKWCKLPSADQNAWITAGQSVQFASKIGNAKITEVKPSKYTTVHKITDGSPLEYVDSNKENSSSMDSGNIIKKDLTKPVRLNNDVTIMPSSKKDEFVVEKIMAKRFNPRKKTWEYNIKWENFGHDSNTWEPISNLNHCKKLLEQFEEHLKRMKEEKAKQGQSPKGRGRPANPKPVKPSSSNFVPIAPKTIATISNVVGGVADDYAGNSSRRPVRSSKQKAMNQVKQWCGNISDDDAQGLKRKYETDSDEDFDDKKIKLEEDSDDSSKGGKPRMSIRKVSTSKYHSPGRPLKNGSQQVLPSNILIPDANGVVRINQKQLPALSSGVYIMSKTAGIIKLDSTTSKVATSGGQTIVKVAPKIGQTQIKIVKKDGNTTKQIIQVSPKPGSTPIRITPVKSSQKFTPKIRKEIKKISQSEKKSGDYKNDPQSDSDDGLEPLPFPAPDEPIPDLEEDKAEDFVLDPETGQPRGAALTKTTPGQVQRRIVQQKVINQAVSQKTPSQQGRTVVRHVIEPSRPGQGQGNINVIRKTVTPAAKSKINLTPQKPLPSPLQPTRTYSAMGGIKQSSPGTAGGAKVQVYSAKSNVSASQTTAQLQQAGLRKVGQTVYRSGQPITKKVVPQKQTVTKIVRRVVSSPSKKPQQVLSNNVSTVKTQTMTTAKPRAVINMPSLTEDDTPTANQMQKPHTNIQRTTVTSKPTSAASTVTQQQQQHQVKVESTATEPQTSTQSEIDTADQTDWSSFTMADSDNPIYVTGEDGTIYQVAGQNEQGQTILITQGPDGQQQCLLVTNEISEMTDEPQPSTSSAGAETTDTVLTQAQESEFIVPTPISTAMDDCIQNPLEIKTDSVEMEGIEEAEGLQNQVVAQVVRAEPPSPGGTHKVVVMLPDGNLMVTQVSPEEYASLELE
ncbi:hypothetical protein ABEB36_005427 [Hypothenemus hampei]|uniref:Chromo domain-containing protein n=1 Tax=Hypothenemus hampei TaxID=57062 RepID=A0ABD1EY68_HYPHA